MGKETRRMRNRNRNNPARLRIKEQNRHQARNRQTQLEGTHPGTTPQTTTDDERTETCRKIHNANKDRVKYARRPIIDIGRKPRRAYGDDIAPQEKGAEYADQFDGELLGAEFITGAILVVIEYRDRRFNEVLDKYMGNRVPSRYGSMRL